MERSTIPTWSFVWCTEALHSRGRDSPEKYGSSGRPRPRARETVTSLCYFSNTKCDIFGVALQLVKILFLGILPRYNSPRHTSQQLLVVRNRGIGLSPERASPPLRRYLGVSKPPLIMPKGTPKPLGTRYLSLCDNTTFSLLVLLFLSL